MSAALSWVPPGPVAAAFMAARDPLHGLMGPVGAGKTSTSLIKHVLLAAAQAPAPDRIRYSRSVTIRPTYPELWSTTIKTWFKWIPKAWGEFRATPPITHHLRFGLPDGTQVDHEAIFVALGGDRIEDVVAGFEPTWAFLNEAALLSEEVLEYIAGRLGRYPSGHLGWPSWWGTFFDCNAPDVQNWIYRRFVEEPKAGERLYRQPSALSREAENTSHLPPGYYDTLATRPKWWRQRMLLNTWGYSRHGLPVYGDEWNGDLHEAAAPLTPDPGLPLILGVDFGLTPAAVFGQQDRLGRWRILKELTTERMGATRLAELINLTLERDYPAWARGRRHKEESDPVIGYGDPAGSAASQTDERSCFDILRSCTGIAWRPVRSNALPARLGAVREALARMVDGSPGLLVSPACRVLLRGFYSDYCFARVAGSDTRHHPAPEKGAASHVHDALQYLILGGDGFGGAGLRRAARRRVPPPETCADYNPFANG